jgi:hypothetical protein
VEKSIVFYECQDVDGWPPFDRLAAVTGINDLEDEDWRVPDATLDTTLAVIVDRVGTATTPTHLRFLRIRPDRPYELSAARQLTPVQVADDSDISEFTWAVLWPDGYMAALASRDAPNHKKLAIYFLATNDQRVHIVNLFDPDVIARLKELKQRGLRKVAVRVKASDEAQAASDNLSTGFKQILNAGKEAQAATITIEYSVGRPRARKLSDSAAADAEELAMMGDFVETMIVKGNSPDGGVDTIDMKRERILSTVHIDAGTRDQDIYRAIRESRALVEQRYGLLADAARGS